MSSLQTLHIQTKNQICWIGFNRSLKMNALNDVLAHELCETLKQADKDPDAKVIILHGMGGNFMSGGDIEMFHDFLHTKDQARLSRIFDDVNSAIQMLRTLSKPVISLVEGNCAGIGLSFMLASDLAYATDTALFYTAYPHIGVSPDGGFTYHLPRQVGSKKAFEIALLSEPLLAPKAQEIGLINASLPAEKLKDHVTLIAETLAQGPSQVYARTKQLLNSATHNSLPQQLKLETQNFITSMQDPDFRIRVEGFLKKKQKIA